MALKSSTHQRARCHLGRGRKCSSVEPPTAAAVVCCILVPCCRRYTLTQSCTHSLLPTYLPRHVGNWNLNLPTYLPTQGKYWYRVVGHSLEPSHKARPSARAVCCNSPTPRRCSGPTRGNWHRFVCSSLPFQSHTARCKEPFRVQQCSHVLFSCPRNQWLGSNVRLCHPPIRPRISYMASYSSVDETDGPLVNGRRLVCETSIS